MSYLDEHLFQQAVELLSAARTVTVFTGAGMSAESGIPTFRDDGGLWQEFPLEEFGHWGGILKNVRRHPDRVARFVAAVLKPIAEAEPNAGHLAIAKLARHRKTTVVTQNVDGLHQEAGSPRVYEVHGSLMVRRFHPFQWRSRISRKKLLRTAMSLERIGPSPLAVLRLALAVRPILGLHLRGFALPDVVLFNQDLPEPTWQNSVNAAESCDAFITVGTSLTVFPAGMLGGIASAAGAGVIVIDPDPTVSHALGEIPLRGKAGKVLPRLIEDALSDGDLSCAG